MGTKPELTYNNSLLNILSRCKDIAFSLLHFQLTNQKPDIDQLKF